ncbi:carboxy terminal-processing peptidase [Sphingobacterium lactis]|uniref:Carboxyl-terminal processing protease n=1 Tax=Sphingobacterium lactis TaxID=797291 RepID=A0A1H5VSX7_9SPHI|nr:carboxy terminal-processing peptidase [Sphingobacterium lactis]SEF90116.1 carboxyl-terminal processing protease [Sphingobacterium lactis]
MFKNLLIALALISVVACGSKPRVNLEEQTGLGLKPTTQHEVIAKEVSNLLENFSYKRVPMGDSLSNIVFDNLVKGMDQGRNYLLQSDIDEFQKYKTSISQDFKAGDLSSSFFMFNRYIERYIQSLNYALEAIDANHDFTKDESYNSFREKLPYFKTEAELKDQWRKRAKYDLLNLRLTAADSAKSDDAKNKETLRSRYNNLISQIKKTNANDAFQLIMTSLTDAVDPHTTYYNPAFAQAFNENMSNTLEGIGASLQMENEMVTIKQIIAGGPAFKDKTLHINDRIIAVGQGESGEFEDIIGWRIDAAVAKIKGKKGTTVRLKILPAGAELSSTPRIVKLTREKIVLAEESAKREIKTVKGEDGKEYRIGVINLPKFYIDFDAVRRGDKDYKSTTRDVRLLLDSLKQDGVDAVLMDLRNNGGGSLQEAIELTGLFIDRGPVVQVRDTRNRVQVDSDEENGVSWDGPFGVIINRFSASASEIFAGAIQDYGRGVVLGSTSYGKGTVQNAVDMSRFISATNKLLIKAAGESDADTPTGAPQFGQINITMGKFYRINGSSTQHKGVTPDVVFPTQYSAEKFGESSEPSALPWDQIKPSNFTQVGNLKTINSQLEEIHKARMAKSPAYEFLLEDIAEFNKNETIPAVSLNEATLKAEREKNRIKNRERINKQLSFMGKPLWKEGQPQPKLEYDFVLEESANVLTDFIRLKNK